MIKINKFLGETILNINIKINSKIAINLKKTYQNINWNQKHDIDFEANIFLIKTKIKNTQKNLSQKVKIMILRFWLLQKV